MVLMVEEEKLPEPVSLPSGSGQDAKPGVSAKGGKKDSSKKDDDMEEEVNIPPEIEGEI